VTRGHVDNGRQRIRRADEQLEGVAVILEEL
jgi:hypothetical protein